MSCRHCGADLGEPFLDLGHAPPSNAYLTAQTLVAPELHFPLRLHVCEACWLVQTADYARADELFDSNYAYYSSVSQTWLDHAATYAGMITERLGLNAGSFVLEIASNDGYLLRNFVRAGIPCMGIEPTAGTAAAAEALGIPVVRQFFGKTLAAKLANEGHAADLIVANNVYAHVPDINDFTQGLKLVLKSGGTITLEFPHLLRLLEDAQFDTVYHEHYSYLSAFSVQQVLEAYGLRMFHIEHLSTHGGSMRVYACHADDPRDTLPSVSETVERELDFGLNRRATYEQLQARARQIKYELLSFLLEQRRQGKLVVGYGAAAKGNTLLNYAGVGPDLLRYVVDAAESKQEKFLPGSHIPILHPSAIELDRPDYVLILPWNIKEEIIRELSPVCPAARFVIAVPKLQVMQ